MQSQYEHLRGAVLLSLFHDLLPRSLKWSPQMEMQNGDSVQGHCNYENWRLGKLSHLAVVPGQPVGNLPTHALLPLDRDHIAAMAQNSQSRSPQCGERCSTPFHSEEPDFAFAVSGPGAEGAGQVQVKACRGGRLDSSKHDHQWPQDEWRVTVSPHDLFWPDCISAHLSDPRGPARGWRSRTQGYAGG